MKTVLPTAQSVLVSYSGGKDSLAVLDLCVRAGKRVEAFMYYLVPGLDFNYFWAEYAREKFGVHVRMYESWVVSRHLRAGVFRHTEIETQQLGLKDGWVRPRQDTGIEWIGIGYKASDSLQRRAWLKRSPGGLCHKDKVFYPVKSWCDSEVRAYLKSRDIIVPDKWGGRMSGINLSPESLLYLREYWPDDYQRVLRVFPLASFQADRALELREQAAKRAV